MSDTEGNSDLDDADGDADLCGHPGANGPCSNPATEPDGSCWLDTHGEDPADGESDGRGPPEGNDNAVGNPGGGPAEGNFNAAKDGLTMAVKRRLEWFDHEQEETFMDYYALYEDKAENLTEAARLASLAVIVEELERELYLDGVWIVKENDDGEEYRIPKQQTLESLFAANRELRLGQDYESITNNSESEGTTGHSGASALWGDESADVGAN